MRPRPATQLKHMHRKQLFTIDGAIYLSFYSSVVVTRYKQFVVSGYHGDNKFEL